MKVGIIGYPLVGKSALYRAAAQGRAKGDVTAVPVPDPRFDTIVAQVEPKKSTPATVILHDDIESSLETGENDAGAHRQQRDSVLRFRSLRIHHFEA